MRHGGGTLSTVFDGNEPLTFFGQCHSDIREHCARLEVLVGDIQRGDADLHVCERVETIVDFFEDAAQQHHVDEEAVFFPRLCSLEVDAAQRLDLRRLIDSLQSDHRALDTLWRYVRDALVATSHGAHHDVRSEVRTFVTANRHHLSREDAGVLPLARRYFDEAAMHDMGLAIVERRLRAARH